MASTTTIDHSTSPSAPAQATGRAPKRDALLDNAKFLLILLVFVGHAIEPVTDTRIANAVYFWIYIFHMPAFVLICGYLSRSFDGSARRIDKLLTTVAAPYVIFWGLYALQSFAVDRNLPDGPLEPLWITWFLAALFVWRLTVPLWNRIRWPLAVAVVVSLAAAFVETGEVLGVSRILSLLPFFVAGLLVRQEHLDFLHNKLVQVWSAAVVLVTAAASYIYFEQLSREWVYWRESLVERDMDLLPIGIPARLVFLAMAFCLTAALLSLTPRRSTWFTRYGALTMYVFLLHGLIIRLAEQFGWYEFTGDLMGAHAEFVLNAAVAVALTFVLCSRPVQAVTGWAVEPRVDWLLRRDPDRAARRTGS